MDGNEQKTLEQIKGETDGIQARIRDKYAEIGHSYYMEHKEVTDGSYAAQISEINDLNRQLEAYPLQTGEEKLIRICPNCKTKAGTEDVFCGNCGYRLPDQNVIQEQPKITLPQPISQLCRQCGTENDSGSVFCWQCGARLESEFNQTSSFVYEKPSNEKKKKKKGFLPLQIMAVILLLCTIVIPVYSQWEGVIPSSGTWTFATNFHYLSKLGIKAFRYRPIMLQATYVIPALLLVVFSCARLKIMSVLSTLAGIIAPAAVIGRILITWNYTVVFNPESGCIGIGCYVVLVLFLICLILSLKTRVSK